MLRGFDKAVLVLAALGVLCSGPVAACVCADAPSAPMPCCPDDGQSLGHADHKMQAEVDVACDPFATDALSRAPPDLPQPAGVSHAALPWLASDLRAPALSAAPPPHASPPIYLVTLRLRN